MRNQGRKRVVAILTVLVMALCLAGCGSETSKDEGTSKQTGEKVCYLTVQDCCDEKTIDYEKGDTAYDLLEKAGLEVEAEGKVGDGVFITKIGNLEGDSSHAWVFNVNDKEAMEAADKTELEPGDSVEYTYIEF